MRYQVTLLRDEHAHVFYGFLLNKAMHCGMMLYQRDTALLQEKFANFSKVGVFRDDKLIQVFMMIKETNTIALRYIYGDYSQASVNALDMLWAVSAIDPSLTTIDAVVSSIDKDLFKAAWTECKFHRFAKEEYWTHHPALIRSNNTIVRDEVIAWNVPIVDIDIVTAKFEYQITDLLY